MYILVSNLGSTSFKYRLFHMPDGEELARGGIDRIGSGQTSACFVEVGGKRVDSEADVPDHAAAVSMCLEQLTTGENAPLPDASQLGGIGFKAVFAGRLSGVRLVNDELLDEMERLADVAPAHNPPYVRAMRQLREAFPSIPLVAGLETGFHETIPEENRVYACPYEWRDEYAVQRWGFHGASHRYIGRRTAELLGRQDLKVISCHLGGSSSICAIEGGESRAASMGMTPQTGLPQSNRVGDFDPFALPVLMRQSGKSLEEILKDLSSKGGLLGLSGLSDDLRDLEEAAANGHERADLAIRHYVNQIKHYVGGYMALLGGVDAIVFTGGIGENSARVRSGVCGSLGYAGVDLGVSLNKEARGEAKLSTESSRVEVWTIPTNEELIVGTQTYELIEKG